jgi:hypothetical protein
LIGPGVSEVGCFIQTDFVAGGKHNFELAALEGTNVVHYWRANDTAATPWRKGDVISTRAIAPGCIVQSDFMSPQGHGNLEAVVPETDGSLVHYWHDSGNPNSGWSRAGVVTKGVTGGACFITSDYTANGHRNFEVMVLKGTDLWHHWHMAGAASDNWPGELVTNGVKAVGPGCLIQSDHQAGGHRNFEVVVQKGSELWHHWHWNGMVGPWPGKPVVSGVSAPGCLMTSDYTSNGIRNFEVLVRKGSELWHHWSFDGMTDARWPGGRVANPVTGVGCFLQGDFGSGTHANFELVVPARIQEPGSAAINEVVHYFKVQEPAGQPWVRAQTVSFHGRSEKVCQLTDDTDWESGIPTTARTQSHFGLGATDLGYPIEHQGRLMLLFGDSWKTHDPHGGDEFQPNDDAVGWIKSRTAPTRSQCTDLVINFDSGPNFTPAKVTGPLQIMQGYFNVPSGGVSSAGGVWAFFWTNHCKDAKPQLDRVVAYPLARPVPTKQCPESDERNSVGRSVMAWSNDDGRTFSQAVPMPIGFVYATAIDATTVEGVPPEQRLGTYVFAVPRYRASIPYLAYAPPGSLRDPSSWLFFVNRKPNGAPLWTPAEVWNRGTGTPWRPPGSPELFDIDRCVGEFSITWNKPLGLWLMLYNCEGAIVARTANAPWGPWSASTVILSPDKDGAPCRLLMTERGCGKQQPYQSEDKRIGGLYAPFVLDRYTTALSSPSPLSGARRARIYWLVSTWDPYQVSVMRTDLEVRDPPF